MIITPLMAQKNEVFPVIVTGFDDEGTIHVNGVKVYDSNDENCNTLIDHCYSISGDTEGEFTVAVVINEGEAGERTYQETVIIVNPEDDELLTSNSELISIDSNIMSNLPCGRGDWRYLIRHATTDIILEMREMGWGNPCDCKAVTCATCCDYIAEDNITFDNIADIKEVRMWANYYVLYLVHDNLWDSVDDVNFRKAEKYAEKAEEYKRRARIKFTDGQKIYKPKTKRNATFNRGL